MSDEATSRIYQQQASAWAGARSAVHLDAVRWLNQERQSGPIIDIGTGPGWHLEPCQAPAVGLDVATAMLELARDRSDHPLVQASAADLPFRSGSVGGAIASRVYNHLPLSANPLALADLHRSLQPDAPVILQFLAQDETNASTAAGWGRDVRSRGPFAGRLNSQWTERGLTDLLDGGGFLASGSNNDYNGCRTIRARRRFSLADTVGAEMAVLVCGLNPSPTSAEMGVGFGRPGNRFWPAALAAGLVSVDRDPIHALRHHGLGMTDLVKRVTRRAGELDAAEYRQGFERVERLVGWLKPRIVCFVGLAGWRTVVDRRAKPGLQPDDLAHRPVYVMPSTSGLNASSRLEDLTEHFRTVAGLADVSSTD